MKKNIKGFTLVELMVAIAIIGILAAAILVGLKKTRVNAQMTAVKSQLAALQPGIALCCANKANSLVTENNVIAEDKPICNVVSGGNIGINYPNNDALGISQVSYTGGSCNNADPTVTADLDGMPDGNDCTMTLYADRFTSTCSF